MATVLIVIHLMIVIAMIAVILLQRSDGGALGIGGGGSMMSRRGAGNALTRATGFLAVTFFATSLGLALLAKLDSRPSDVLDRLAAPPTSQNNAPLPQLPTSPSDGEGPGVLDALRGEQQPSVPRE